jgi:hypothetical protein
MSSPYESATLIIRLYELRRDPTMREARIWFARSFNPATITSYWDMAASFVLNGAIDEKMFNDANGEQHVVFSKIEPFIAEYRSRMGNPGYLASLETVVMKTPGAPERMAMLRERFKAMAAR